MSELVSIFAFNCVVVALTILIHFEVLFRMADTVPSLRIRPRLRVLLGMFGAFVAHVIEIWIFAAAYFILLRSGNFGSLAGNFDGSLIDCCYFSFTTYTSLGFGDVEPFGQMRFLTGLEALTGLMLITWTASFMFLQMQKFWGSEKKTD